VDFSQHWTYSATVKPLTVANCHTWTETVVSRRGMSGQLLPTSTIFI